MGEATTQVKKISAIPVFLKIVLVFKMGWRGGEKMQTTVIEQQFKKKV